MPIKIDERAVRTAKAPAKGDNTIWDSEVKGFGLRVFAPTRRNPQSARSFFINYRIAGVERRHTIGDFPVWSALAARNEAKELRRRIDRGEDPARERREDREAPTVADLAERYRRERLPSKAKRSQAGDLSMIANEILPAIGERKVKSVHFGDLKAIHERITARGAQVHANRVIAVASTMFELALKPMAGEDAPWRDAAMGNPCRGIPRNKEQGRERFFSSAEIAALTDALTAYGQTSASDCLCLIMLTGCRPGEAMRATWAEFAEPGVWAKPSAHTKQRKTHRTPLSPGATEFIEKLRAEKPEGVFLFPGQKQGAPLTQVRAAWEIVTAQASVALWTQSSDERVARLVADLGAGATVEACRAEAQRRKIALPAALVGARVYDLRHTFASIGAGGGLSLQVIGRLLGHSTARTTEKYAHLSDDPLREAAAKIGGVIAGAGKSNTDIVILPKRGGA